MILRNRLYERKEPDRDATLCIIYYEERKRKRNTFGTADKSVRIKNNLPIGSKEKILSENNLLL